MPSFPGVDFLDFDSLLSDEEKLARKTARQFVDDANHADHRGIQPRRKISRCNWCRRWPNSVFSARA